MRSDLQHRLSHTHWPVVLSRIVFWAPALAVLLADAVLRVVSLHRLTNCPVCYSTRIVGTVFQFWPVYDRLWPVQALPHTAQVLVLILALPVVLWLLGRWLTEIPVATALLAGGWLANTVWLVIEPTGQLNYLWLGQRVRFSLADMAIGGYVLLHLLQIGQRAFRQWSHWLSMRSEEQDNLFIAIEHASSSGSVAPDTVHSIFRQARLMHAALVGASALLLSLALGYRDEATAALAELNALGRVARSQQWMDYCVRRARVGMLGIGSHPISIAGLLAAKAAPYMKIRPAFTLEPDVDCVVPEETWTLDRLRERVDRGMSMTFPTFDRLLPVLIDSVHGRLVAMGRRARLPDTAEVVIIMWKAKSDDSTVARGQHATPSRNASFEELVRRYAVEEFGVYVRWGGATLLPMAFRIPMRVGQAYVPVSTDQVFAREPQSLRALYGTGVFAPNLVAFWESLRLMTLDQARAYIEARVRETEARIPVAGTSIDARLIRILGPLVVLALLIQLQQHVIHARRYASIASITTFPWLLLYPGRVGAIANALTVLVLGPLACLCLIRAPSLARSDQFVLFLLSGIVMLAALFAFCEILITRRAHHALLEAKRN